MSIKLNTDSSASIKLEWNAYVQGANPASGILLYWRAMTGVSITGASQANPCVIDAPGHGLTTGNSYRISEVVGMTELNDKDYTITVIDSDSFSLDGIDSTAYTAYSSGGVITPGQLSNTDNSIKLPIQATSYKFEGVAADLYYRFGVAVYKTTLTGMAEGDIKDDPTWKKVHPTTTPNFIGNIDGEIASTVKSNAADGKNAYDEFGNRNVVNLIKNWSFENGTTGNPPTYWGYSETGSTPNADTAFVKSAISSAPDGSYAAYWEYLGVTGDWTQRTKLSDPIKILDNTIAFALSAWYNAQAVLITDVSLSVYMYSDVAGTTYLGVLDKSIGVPTTSWQKKNAIITAGELNTNTKAVRIGITIDGNGAGIETDKMYFDAISFYAGGIASIPNPFVLTEDTQSVDVAEKYIVTGESPRVGNIVTFGQPVAGKPSIRIATGKDRQKPLFIISDRYYFTLNNADSHHPGYDEGDIALVGRVPCRVIGKVFVNDKITIHNNGIGRVAVPEEGSVGFAITNKNDNGEGSVIVFVERK